MKMKMKNFNEFLKESQNFTPKVKKGEKVNVICEYLQGAPEYPVEAYEDSDFNEYFKTETFSYLHGGDMMMIAKWNGKDWISNG
jgi:hypothetical protein